MKLDDYESHEKKPIPKQFVGKTFQKGNELWKLKGTKPKQELTVYDVQTMENMRTFRKFMQSYGISRVMELMKTLSPEEFFKTFILLAPYSLPKIASVEARDIEGKEVYDITDAQQVHTITIKDMRSNTTTTILDE
jgi:hypothetical protein